jgi:hypothetical protein
MWREGIWVWDSLPFLGRSNCARRQARAARRTARGASSCFVWSRKAPPVQDTEDVQRLLGPDRVGTTVTAAISRGGNPVELSIQVAERPRLPA